MENVQILVVDDEKSILSALNRALTREGIQVMPTNSPKQALQLLSQEKFAVIISDMMMPEMNGVELLEMARQISPETMRIMLTGNADVKMAIEAINRGSVYKFLVKPWLDDELFQVILEALSVYERMFQNTTQPITDITKQAKESQALVNKALSSLGGKTIPTIMIAGTLGVINFQLKFLLRDISPNIRIVNSVNQALKEFENKEYRLMIVDLCLPSEHDGYFLLQTCQNKAAQEHLDCKFIILTAHDYTPQKDVTFLVKNAKFIPRQEGWQVKLVETIQGILNKDALPLENLF